GFAWYLNSTTFQKVILHFFALFRHFFPAFPPVDNSSFSCHSKLRKLKPLMRFSEFLPGGRIGRGLQIRHGVV
ncbi:MAG: hypothetical protein IIZ96_06445, partial [Oscillospiraceae bacterium]|nr:hypothetical protein [Oscillospiraceae bacterium]